jgi:hypothetical protein
MHPVRAKGCHLSLSDIMRAARGPTVAAVAVFLLTVPAAGQQSQPAAQPSIYVLTAPEALAVRSAAQANTTVSTIVGTGSLLVQTSGVQLSKVSYSGARATRTPRRSVTVIVFNPRTRAAASARVQLSTNVVTRVEALTPDEVPLFTEEAEAALALARSNADVRAAVGATIDNYRLRISGTETQMPYSAEAMKLFAPGARDTCNAARCVALHFRSGRVYLPLRVVVNLSTRAVTVVRRDRRNEHGGMHP